MSVVRVRRIGAKAGPVALGLVLLATLVAWGLRVYHTRFDGHVAVVAQAVRARFVTGDVVVTSPTFIGVLQPLLGDLPLVSVKSLTREQLVGYRRVHLASFDAVFGSDEQHVFLRSLGKEDVSIEAPGVTLSTFTLNAPDHVVMDLHARLAEAEVTVRYPGGEWQSCGPYRGRAFACPRDPGWNYVGQEWFALDDIPTRCVWMHPVKPGGALRVTLPDVADASRLLLTYGFTSYGARFAEAPVDVRLLRGERELWHGVQLVRPERSTRWIELARDGETTGEPLTLEVTSPHNGAGHFCLNAQAVRS